MALRRLLVLSVSNKNVRSISTACNKTLRAYTGDTDFKTHFGFQTVDEKEKAGKVREVFDNVALKYDLMNDAMSLGIHRVWKDALISTLAPLYGTKLLDVAGGTGDIAFRYIKYIRSIPQYLDKTEKIQKSSVTVLDINESMLKVGKQRAQEQGFVSDNIIDINWMEGDAEKLEFPDESFTAYTIAFGIRNCTHIDKVLEEAYRVLQPGGRFLCLEFSKMQSEQMQKIYDEYSFRMIPVLGQMIAGQYKPYQYLVESIRKFPDQEAFKTMIENAGFRCVTFENQTFGVCSIHSGYKL